MLNVYQEQGYKDRRDYLECMAEDYGVPFDTVLIIADTIGENEDFDGLIAMLEDYSEIICKEV